MTSIPNISLPPITPPAMPSAEVAGKDAAGSANFTDFFMNALDQVNSMQMQADQAVEQYVTGGPGDPAEVLTAVQKADITFRLMMQIRNKLVQAYQEVKDIRI